MSGQRKGSLRAWVFSGVGGLRLHLSPSQQASFLITNALRFMLHAPGVTSWQYTLLQLQVTPSFLLACFPPSLALPPSLQPGAP